MNNNDKVLLGALEAECYQVVVYEEDYPRAHKTVAQMLEEAVTTEADNNNPDCNLVFIEEWIVEKGDEWHDHPSSSHCELLNRRFELVQDLKDRYLNMRDYSVLIKPKDSDQPYTRLGPFAIPVGQEMIMDDLIEFIQEMAQFEAKPMLVDTPMADFLFLRAQEEDKKLKSTPAQDAIRLSETEPIDKIPETLLARDPELEPTGE